MAIGIIGVRGNISRGVYGQQLITQDGASSIYALLQGVEYDVTFTDNFELIDSWTPLRIAAGTLQDSEFSENIFFISDSWTVERLVITGKVATVIMKLKSLDIVLKLKG